MKVGGVWSKGNLGRASGSDIEHLVWGVKQCKPARGSWGMPPGNFETEIL